MNRTITFKIPFNRALRIKGYKIPYVSLERYFPSFLILREAHKQIAPSATDVLFEEAKNILDFFYDIPKHSWVSFMHYDYNTYNFEIGLFDESFKVKEEGEMIEFEDIKNIRKDQPK